MKKRKVKDFLFKSVLKPLVSIEFIIHAHCVVFPFSSRFLMFFDSCPSFILLSFLQFVWGLLSLTTSSGLHLLAEVEDVKVAIAEDAKILGNEKIKLLI